MTEGLIGHDNDFVFLSITVNKWKVGGRVPDYATPKIPLWHMGYFDLKSTENQQMQKNSKNRAHIILL